MTTVAKIIPLSPSNESIDANRTAGALVEIEGKLKALQEELDPCKPQRTITIIDQAGNQGIFNLPNRKRAQAMHKIIEVSAAIEQLESQLKNEIRGSEGLYRKEIDAIRQSIFQLNQTLALYASWHLSNNPT
jgi:hypothetical protein